MQVDIIGRGNVAYHLRKAMSEHCDVRMVNPHTLDELREDSDIYLISVADRAIKDVANALSAKISNTSAIMAHTAGSVPMSLLKDVWTQAGVFYPLQTFSKDVALDYSEIPFFIEGVSQQIEEKLTSLASLISKNVALADSAARSELHLASVLGCNFVNHLWALSERHLNRSGISFEKLIPLLQETLRKASTAGPQNSQTGPAARHDKEVMKMQYDKLIYDPQAQAIYKLLSESIMTDRSK